MLETWNRREAELISSDPARVPGAGQPALRRHRPHGPAAGRRARAGRRRRRARCRRASMAATAISRTRRAAPRSTSRSTSMARACRWATCTSAVAMARSLLRRHRDGGLGPHARVADQGRHGQVRHPQSDLQAQPDHAGLQRLPDLRRHLGGRGGQAALPRRERGLPPCLPERHRVPDRFGYSRARAYSILGTAPVQGHISGVVDVPNACATLWLPTQIFDFDIRPSASGPARMIQGGVDLPLSPDLP